MEKFTIGDVQLSSASASAAAAGAVVASSLGTFPSYVLQLKGLDKETPVRSVTEALAKALPGVKLLKTDRSALLKFKRHREVVPGMVALKELLTGPEGARIGGAGAALGSSSGVKVQRYRPLEVYGDSEYDEPIYPGYHGGGDDEGEEEESGSGNGKDNKKKVLGKSRRSKAQAAVHTFTLESVLQDYMHLDPATRYQIAKNAFERELLDASVSLCLCFLY